LKENNIQQLTDREHVLKRPGMYISSVKPVEQELYIFDRNSEKMVKKKLNYVPGLLKIIKEILDNSIDEHIRTNGKFANKIDIEVSDTHISIRDNGRGIPFETNKKDITGCEMAWCHLRAGSNFDDEDVDNTTIGQNGLGASLANIMSLKFIGESCQGTKKVTISTSDNMSTINKKITTCRNKFTKVSVWPDFKRFSIDSFTKIHQDMLYTDILNLSLIYPKLHFTWNKKPLEKLLFKDYLNTLSEDNEIIEVDGLKIGVFHNNLDEFSFIHNINGVNVYDGGNPLNWVTNNIANTILERLQKRFKSLKVGDIKSKLGLVVFFDRMTNPRFDSQSKTKCINTITDFKTSFDYNKMDFVKFTNKIIKNKVIIDSIIEVFKIKEEFEKRKALKGLKPDKKKVRIEKYLPPAKEKKYLVLSEGDSANGSVSSVLGREFYGYFPLKGKPLNILEVDAKKIANNDEIRNILQILNLDITVEKQKLEFENVLIATDADADGHHITGLLLVIFTKFYPELIKQGKVKRLRTPIVVGRIKNEIKKYFFTLEEYNDFKSKTKRKFDYHYYKGLGTWKSEDLEFLIKQDGLDNFIETLEWDDETSNLVDLWFLKDNSDLRKNKIKDIKFNIDEV